MKSKTVSSQLRIVRKDTKMGTFEKKYGVSLGVRADMTLSNYLKKIGHPSLSNMLLDTT